MLAPGICTGVGVDQFLDQRFEKGAEGGIYRIFTKRGSLESYSSADYSAAHESALFLTDRELYNFEFRASSAPFHTAHA